MPPKRIFLNAFDMSCVGHQAPGLWRHPDDQAYRYTDLDYWIDLARLLERGRFDSLFLADVLGVYDVYTGSRDPAVRQATQIPLNDPLLVVSAMAAATEHLGFGVTVSLTYEQPYALARKFTTLDHLTKGRIAWNVVTSYLDSAARNLGMRRQRDHDDRYEVAEEFLEVCYKLWEGSWEDDAVVLDRAAGRYVDPTRIHHPNIAGPHVKVAGALTTPRPPQGHPVLVQAGSSTTGRRFAAAHAEAIFTAHLEKASAVAFYRDIKDQASALGRLPEEIVILPGISPVIGSTEAEAQRLDRELNELTVPAVGLEHLSNRFGGHDFSHLDLDAVLSVDDFPDPETVQAARSRTEVIISFVRRERPTLRALLHKLAGARGHLTVVGTPEQIANTIEDWFESGAADGFNVMPPILPYLFDVFADEVVPILQKRGLFRTRYEGRTLRDHYGLERPANRFFEQASPALEPA